MQTHLSRPSRRGFVKGMISIIALSAIPFKLLARSATAFKATATKDVYKELFGDLPMVGSSDIELKIPDIAENGAVVPVSVSTSIANVEAIYVIIEQNPNPLSASFMMTPLSVPEISIRVKMGKSSMVQALVKTADKVYMTGQEVKVTIGGCGG